MCLSRLDTKRICARFDLLVQLWAFPRGAGLLLLLLEVWGHMHGLAWEIRLLDLPRACRDDVRFRVVRGY